MKEKIEDKKDRAKKIVSILKKNIRKQKPS